ncbi:mitochondrial coenzyme A diphosphatase NUDT8 [Tribolium castaneum]|uniref:Nucleoside diphosphate-linked moiety X motif 8, mitochondrial-like Protein n=1 Tax=Tribolium castaneum TaxID=7070 RepID=D6WYZ7_TRICA|nr:PREDICTED: nucleoside diphosphate-linked moiety X motif 8 [Tribolium castaneum]EFA09028.1 Nucleoside diphosphate-linked moiety X motif 8, mitochondrial-like Protein [Tribolium castaneum]|eukprot:XP_970071.1 PREDICTED: nucleoside diphosphate-linked moiety X motif 8 [Tribolium castaneum]
MFPVSKIPRKPHLVQCFSAFSAESIFSEENIRKTVANFAKMRPVKTQPSTPTKNAAVLVPLCVVEGRVSLLYTLRAANLKTHRGQVSFPGGMEDAGDKTAEQTAVRETQEELGIGQDLIEVWGKGNVIVSRNVTSVLPVIGALKIGDVRDLRINPSEVKEVFTVPLEVLCDPEHIRHTQFRTNYSLPVFTGGRRKIWGLTAIITHLFLKALMPKSVYNPSIKFVPPLKGSLPYRLL